MNNFTTTYTTRSSERVASRPERILLHLLGSYRILRAGRIAPCRFYPSCSDYASEAIVVHGAGRGSWLAIRRIFRCRPFGAHGIDLVPVVAKTGQTP